MASDPRFRFLSSATILFGMSIVLSAAVASADPQTTLNRDLVFSPSPDLLRHENGRRKRPEQPMNKATRPRSVKTDWTKFPKDFWLTEWSGRNISPELRTSTGNSVGTGAVKSVAPAAGVISQNDSGLFGRSSLQFRTEKNFQTPEPFRRTDCNEEECADYSGFPKYKPSKTNAKNIRKPYLGLSITTPIQ